MRRRAALLVTALVLAGCAQPLPEPDPDAVPAQVGPALAESQVERVLADLAGVLEEADATALATEGLDAAGVTAQLDEAVALLSARATDPAVQVRAAQYRMATVASETAITAIPAGAQTVVAPATDAWPRTVMVITEPPEDLRAPLLLTVVQAEPRAPYRLVSWSRLFGGVQAPATVQPSVGSAPVPADGGEAALTPNDVLAHYVDLLTAGTESAYAAEFAASPFADRIAQQRAAWVTAVGEGSVTETYAVAAGEPYALATADGGAIVVGALQTVTTLTLVDSTLTIGDETAALLGATTVSSSLEITWTSMLAFAVPPAGSTDPITLLGAEHVPVKVTGS